MGMAVQVQGGDGEEEDEENCREEGGRKGKKKKKKETICSVYGVLGFTDVGGAGTKYRYI
jgi:hypothetical protein